ncbi:MAG: energy-coupled thiamine transporter ThiT [Candidatus Paraimprobicoccus trichonymphae]|uniref:Energy-coupled thiamine transporter ThiT n=1 Tax=Candidatus Paraimprobicoccus trichonymphae TaxID=3033793 RepID=A0AA48L1H0_9FIRM|nr:MAG: energy-coupled thiamine transporter ThiT [Candidatus Paraimprobicoccus trichonymphae]
MSIEKLKKFLISSLIISLAVILSKICVFKLPNGGSVNLSMIPIVLCSLLFGNKLGILSGLIYSVIKIVLNINLLPIVNIYKYFTIFILDYIFPYIVLGFTNMINKKTNNIKLSVFIVIFLRFLSHFTSGIVIWSEYIENLNSNVDILVYSLIYNCSYLIPEAIIVILFFSNFYSILLKVFLVQ